MAAKLPGKSFRKDAVRLGSNLSVPIDIRVTPDGKFYCIPRDPLSDADGPKISGDTADQCKMAVVEWLAQSLREGLKWELSLVFEQRVEQKLMIGGQEKLGVQIYHAPLWTAKTANSVVYVHAVCPGLFGGDVELAGPKHGFYRRVKDSPRALPPFMKCLPYDPKLTASLKKLEAAAKKIGGVIMAINELMHAPGASPEAVSGAIDKELPDAPSK